MIGAGRACLFVAAVLAWLGQGHLAASAQTAEPAAAAPAKPAASAKSAKKAKKKDGDEATADAKAKPDPAAAQALIDGGVKNMQAGKLDPAIAAFSSVIARGKVPANIMARALYNRGVAYRRQAKPAQAIADLQSALWLKGGLSDAERADAQENRAAAYREAGLPDQTDSEGRVAPGRTRTANEPSVATRQASPAATASLPPSAEQPAASGGVGNFFGNLFGGNQTAAKPEAPAPAPKSASVSAWSNATEVSASAPPAKSRISVAKVEAVPGPASVVVAGGGQFRIQLAMAKTRADAQVTAAKAGQALGGGGEAQIDETSFGGATYYRVRIGAYGSQADAQAQCARLKAADVDCHVAR